MNCTFSFIILTFNEELHLERLLTSISDLNAAIVILDSGSTDRTKIIGEQFGAVILEHQFENHPKQWDYALKNLPITTPWVICLDADQIVTLELKNKLQNFRDEDHMDTNGIYFNRKNFFKGKWIKHGGYFPFYLLKMFRFGIGYSDLNENMDHRFIVPGHLEIWGDGILIEENLKENNISFWIEKHNRYSDLVAQEEVERLKQIRTQSLKPNFWGSPDQRTAWRKQIWWKLPRYFRPFIYFIQRMIFQLGILDGRTGIIFHFLQGFWFRLIVDVKIEEILNQHGKVGKELKRHSPLRFVVVFLGLFAAFYYFNIFFFGLTTPGKHYYSFLDNYLNYIRALRNMLLFSTSHLINWFGYTSIINSYELLVAGRGTIKLVYSCLGLGVMSFFSAFVIAYPKKWKSKTSFLLLGLFTIQILNILRFVLLALFWDKKSAIILDHHTVFNILIYVIISTGIYFWVKMDDNKLINSAKN